MGILTEWERRFPNSEPIAHRLRVVFSDRWVRFHSLPDSKRYPEDEAEYGTVCERHNRILGRLAHAGQPVVLLSTGYSETPMPIRADAAWRALDPDAVPWRTVAMHEGDGDFGNPSYWHLFASERVWWPGGFDPLVRRVATGAIADAMIVAPDGRWLLHPYDGGMDVIAESAAVRDRLKAGHAGWLSAREDGL